MSCAASDFLQLHGFLVPESRLCGDDRVSLAEHQRIFVQFGH